MIWKRLAKTFLVGAGMCTFGIGCAAVDALVSSPYGDDSESPDRLTAIARVYENQGHYTRAQRLYREALKKQPNNLFARERLATLQKRNSSRTFSNDGTAEAVAIADSLNSGARIRAAAAPQPVASPASRQSINATTVSATQPRPATGVASLKTQPQQPQQPTQPAEELATAADLATEFAEETLEPAIQVGTVASAGTDSADDELSFSEFDFPLADELLADGEAFLPTVDEATEAEVDESPGAPLPPADADFASLKEEAEPSVELAVDPSVELAVVTEESEPAGLNFAPASSDVQQTAFDEHTTVTLPQILEWMEQPEEHTADLIRALQFGEDAGVCALAASGLGQCPADESFERVLREAAGSESELLKVTSLDALILHGATKKADVEVLLTLATSESAGIRSQSAATLRNLAGTPWSDACVAGLGSLLDDTDETVRLMAASTLGDFGADAEPQRAALTRLAETDSTAAAAAQLALHRINTEPVSESSESPSAD